MAASATRFSAPRVRARTPVIWSPEGPSPVGVAVGVMLAQQVAAEIAGQIVPHAVDVVGVVLGVVVLDQADRAVQAPVVGVAVLERAAPGEVDLSGTGLPDAAEFGLGE